MSSVSCLCSIIIPTYNRRRLLAEAVGSVLNQSYFGACWGASAGPSLSNNASRSAVELIIVDDGSTDDTPAYLSMLAGHAARHGRAFRPGGSSAAGRSTRRISLRNLRIPHCGMPGAVRNRGAELAGGRYIAFLDSDDLWTSDKLARQMALHHEQPELVLSHTHEHWVRGTRRVRQPAERYPKYGDVFIAALEKCMIGPSTTVVKRSVFERLGGFCEHIQVGEDYEFWLRLTAQHQVGYIPEPLTIKRAGHSATEGEQLSERYGRIEFFRLRALAIFLSGTRMSPAQLRAAHEAWLSKCRIYAAGRAKRNYPDEAAALRLLAEQPPGFGDPLPDALRV